MDIQTAAILGAWIFATATVVAKNVAGGFMVVSLLIALFVTGCFFL
jgi:hypothetical protein